MPPEQRRQTKRRESTYLRAITTTLLFFSLTAAHAAEYVLGVVPQFEPRRLHAIWQPIANELSKASGHEITLKMSNSIPEFEQEFANGQFDIAYMNPWHAVIANDRQGYLPLVRDSGRQLRGILVVRKDGDINEIADLNGSTIAFPAPNALGASLLMRAELRKLHQLDFTPLYVKTHSSVYLNVALRSTAAGGGVGRTLREQPKALHDKLEVIHKTRPVNPHPLSIHPRVPAQVAAAISTAMLELAAHNQKRHLLRRIPMNKPVAASIDDYLNLRDWGLDEFYVRPEN